MQHETPICGGLRDFPAFFRVSVQSIDWNEGPIHVPQRYQSSLFDVSEVNFLALQSLPKIDYYNLHWILICLLPLFRSFVTYA